MKSLQLCRKNSTQIKYFHFPAELSDEINLHQFNTSFLLQPKLYLRIRPGLKEIVIDKINKANVFV